MALAVRTVFTFAVGRFGIDIDTGLGTDGNPDADLYAGIAVFAVLMLAVLGGEQPDVARGIEADGVARSNVAALDGNVALAAADIDVAAGFQAALLALAVCSLLAVLKPKPASTDSRTAPCCPLLLLRASATLPTESASW